MFYHIGRFFRRLLHRETAVDESLEKLSPRVQLEIIKAGRKVASLLRMEELQKQIVNTHVLAEESGRLSENLQRELGMLSSGILGLTEQYTDLLGKFNEMEKELKYLKSNSGGQKETGWNDDRLDGELWLEHTTAPDER